MGRYPWAEVLLLEVLHIIVLYPARQHAYRVAALATMIYLSAQIYKTMEVTSPISVGYFTGITIAFHFLLVAYLLITDGPFPDHWKRVRDGAHTKADTGGSDKLPPEPPLTRKLWWVVSTAYSLRSVGWVQEPRNGIPSHPPPSRRTFLRKTFLKLIVNTVTFDLSTSVLALSPAFDSRVHDPTDGPETYLAAVPLLHRIPYVLSYGAMMGAMASIGHNIMALVCVGLGSSPTMWPDVWGRWGDAYTVRKLWGRTWHQRLRPMFVGLGRFITNKLLKFPRSSIRSSYTQLYVAFFLSGLLHSSGDFMLEKRMVYRSFKFFLLQAVAITVEDLVIHVAKRLLRRREIETKPGGVDESWAEAVARVVGYCWVILWFCMTMPLWLDEASAVGLGNTDRGVITQFLLDRWRQRA